MDGENVFRQPPVNDKPPEFKKSILYSKWAEKFRWFVRVPMRSPVMGVFAVLVGTAIITNTVTRLVYGPNHPLNRFNWRRMEKRGEISRDLIEKKKAFDEYYLDKMRQWRYWSWTNKSTVDSTSFSNVNLD